MSNLQAQVDEFQRTFTRLEEEIGGVIVGMHEVVRHTLTAVFAGGHVLLEGVPGLGKTLLVKSIASAFGLDFKRVQFTPDLMPSDVTGTEVITEDAQGKRVFQFKPGPLFCNIVLADEVNRATPKTQSALLEAMEEKQVTVLDHTHTLPFPFFVLATQNPVELEGTYPLPEAQLDRFMKKLHVAPPSSDQLKEVLKRTTGAESYTAKPVFPDAATAEQAIAQARALVRSVAVTDPMLDVLVRVFEALTPTSSHATEKVTRYVRFGPGPRGAQALMLSAKTEALLDGRVNLAFEDMKKVLLPTLRHRLLLNFQAEADGITADDIIHEVRTAK